MVWITECRPTWYNAGHIHNIFNQHISNARKPISTQFSHCGNFTCSLTSTRALLTMKLALNQKVNPVYDRLSLVQAKAFIRPIITKYITSKYNIIFSLYVHPTPYQHSDEKRPKFSDWGCFLSVHLFQDWVKIYCQKTMYTFAFSRGIRRVISSSFLSDSLHLN